MGSCLLHMIWALLATTIITTPMITSTQPVNTTNITSNTAKPGCRSQCGNLAIPYPFGIWGSGCSLNSWYDILCATSYDPPRAFSPVIKPLLGGNGTMIEVLGIIDTHIRVRNQFVAYACYNSSGDPTTGPFSDDAGINYDNPVGLPAPYRLSASANSLVVLGCNDQGDLSGGAVESGSNVGRSSCNTNCTNPSDVVAGECNGEGCCQASIQGGMRYFSVDLLPQSGNHSRIASWNPCGYAFVGEQGKFKFNGASDLNDSMSLVERIRDEVPVVLDWVIGEQKCDQAKQNLSSYLCKQPNTECDDADPVLGGYRCSCKEGYQGNPYLPPGCTDTNECEGENNCSMRCVNTPGSYYCYCPSGYSGNGRTDGTACTRLFPKIPVALGSSVGFILLIIGLSWMVLAVREKRLMKRRSKLFQQNGGFLLKQLAPSEDAQSPHVFTIKELMAATNNFSEGNIVGKGGYGTVYKGILPGNQVVAVKKSKVVDETQIEQFINELVILTRIDHPNVVKLMGCCLETEVPLLVYEFISNGTLYDRIQTKRDTSDLSWNDCLRIAAETAEALAYLHSIPIIHRDIKPTNILLDDEHRAKLSDFGISRLIPMDKTRLATLVQGTLGYLDPEYFFSSELTNKSDVYSFGVVLAELLTREAPLLDERRTEERNLSVYFVKSMKANCLTDIVYPQFVKEASHNQLVVLGELIKSCLSVRGEDRPTMKEVAEVLVRLSQFQK